MKRSPLKRSPLKRKKKLNIKNFTPDQIKEIWESQSLKCARCGKKSCSTSTMEHGLRYPVPHHRKPKSALSPAEVEEFGRGGGVKNGVGLCMKCHSDVHNKKPFTEQFRTMAWQDIGETEEEYINSLPDD